MNKHIYFVYIMANSNNRSIYIGITNDIKRRVAEHQSNLKQGFSWKYNTHKLVYFEKFDYVSDAILKEKRMKKWNREWKNNLINKDNPQWNDLSPTL